MVDSPPVPATNPTDDTCPPELRGDGGVALAAEMLRRMLRIRRFEEATIALFHGGELPASVHSASARRRPPSAPASPATTTTT